VHSSARVYSDPPRRACRTISKRPSISPTHLVTRRRFPRRKWHSGSARLGRSDRGLPRSAPAAATPALRFPEYVESQSALEHHRPCSDMARLELAYIEIFDAADASPISPEALAGISDEAWQRVRIAFHPALRLLKTEYPVAPLRRQLIEAQTSAEDLLMPAREPQCQLLFRRDLQGPGRSSKHRGECDLLGFTRGLCAGSSPASMFEPRGIRRHVP
jgi:hypothetical protein